LNDRHFLPKSAYHFQLLFFKVAGVASSGISSYQLWQVFPCAFGMQEYVTSHLHTTPVATPLTIGNREEQHFQLIRNKEKVNDRFD
jgi:hypothetical protein